MPRIARIAPGGLIYHVLNRSVARLPLFRKDADYAAFEQVILETQEKQPTRILAWCLMRNHWHFVLWPRKDGELTAFLRRLAHTHAMRWHVAHGTVGCGHLYQGRFKCFPVAKDEHFLTVCRYVERNALTAKVVERAEDWRWSSLWAKQYGPWELRQLLTDWPVERPRNWVAAVNQPFAGQELNAIHTSMSRNRPFGSARWQKNTCHRLGLTHTLRPEGRPKKKQPPEKRS